MAEISTPHRDTERKDQARPEPKRSEHRETPEKEETGFQPLASSAEPLVPVVEDARGVGRIAGPSYDAWEPAQVDPTDEQKKAAEDFEKRQKEQERRQHELFKTGSVKKDSDK